MTDYTFMTAVTARPERLRENLGLTSLHGR